MVPLEHNWAWLFFIGIECAARHAWHLADVDNFRSIHGHRHAVGNQGYFIGLPLARGSVGLDGGDDEPVESPLAMDIHRAVVAIQYLDFIPPRRYTPLLLSGSTLKDMYKIFVCFVFWRMDIL